MSEAGRRRGGMRGAMQGKGNHNIQTTTGVTCATLPTSSSAWTIRFILATGNLVLTMMPSASPGASIRSRFSIVCCAGDPAIAALFRGFRVVAGVFGAILCDRCCGGSDCGDER